MKMINFIRYVQLAAVLFVLASTLIAFFIELKVMYDQKHIALADLLLMFIYIEVIGLVRSYWETRAVRITYPLVIAITALARYIILQDKDGEPATLIYIALAILIISIAAVVIRMRNSKYLKIDYTKSNDL
ncbi:MAG: phosphate-starvation-inducible PsiE family protein [Pelagibacteraceae bacterium]|jgi:protein PsiE